MAATAPTTHEARHLAAVYDVLPSPIALLDPQARIIRVNAAWHRFAREAGFDPSFDFIGELYFDVCAAAAATDGESAQQVREGLLRVLRGEEPQFEAEYACAAGAAATAARWLRVIASNLPPELGGGAIVQHVDITESKQAAESLARLSHRLHSLREIDKAILALETPVQIAEAALSRLREVVPCDRASVVLLAAERDEAVILATDGLDVAGNTPGQRLPIDSLGDIGPLARGEVHTSYDEGTPARHPTIARLAAAGIRGGLRAPLRIGGDLIGCLNLTRTTAERFREDECDAAAEVAGQLAVALQQARLHEAVQTHAAELERRVRERTAELKHANAELASFTASVSHDLRAPLRAITGFAEALLEEEELRRSNSLAGDVRRILAASRRMRRLIDGLLQLSGIQRRPFKPAVIDLSEVACEIAADLEKSHPDRAVEWTIATGLQVAGDPELVRAVVQNLLENGFKYTRDRPIAEITLAPTHPP